MSIFGSDIVAVLVAAALAAVGGDAFLKGVLGAARWLHVPKVLVATTLAAFATSSPELTVSTLAALAGRPEIGLGDALGSNVVNIALIFGLALLFGPIQTRVSDHGRDFALAIAVPLVTLLLAFDGSISRLDGGLLLLIFAGWLVVIARAGANNQAAEESPEATYSIGQTVVYAVGGLLILILAGRFFVAGATGLVSAMGVAPYVIGATVVAIGTSLPELVTMLFARIRGHDEVGVGTLLGSNLFNGLGIVGVATSIHPASVAFKEILFAATFGIGALLCLIPNRAQTIPRLRGLILIALYAAFVVATVTSSSLAGSES